MMKRNIAVNGFGRIGRLVFRQLMDFDDVNVVAINDIAPLDNLVYLLRHDSAQAAPKEDISLDGDILQWNDKNIKFLSVRDPAELPWRQLQADIVIEASGLFTKREAAAKHLEAGAQRVIITAPGKGADITICMGVNEEKYNPDHDRIISNASCTTNCLAPVAKVLDDEFGIQTGFLTTVHAYTSSQSLIDAPSKKWRRGRAAAVSIVPTTTGAAIATTEVLPQLKGKIDGLAMRVPVPAGSIIDFVAQTKEPVTVEKVNAAFRKATSSQKMKGILEISDEELVSSDVVGSTFSAIVDGVSTMTLGENSVKVLAWYDNEWGYSRRVVDLARYVAKLEPVEDRKMERAAAR
jgi:glyceraldehyde 3-phosphate dehydrogenase